KEPHKNINPDEVVALGAAVQAGIMQGDVKDILLLDVTPLSLGLETLGGVMTVLIQKNTTIPTAKTQIFSTASDSQPQVEIHVLQGERPMAGDNKTLGRFILDGIPPSQRGVPQIEVAFDIDANGILSVSAKDKATGKTQSIRIEGSSGLSKDEIERMKKEAELHAQEDAKKKESSESKITAEALIYSTEKTLKDLGEKVPADVKKEIDEKLEDLKKVKDSSDVDIIKSKTEELSRTLQKIGADLYKQASAESSGQAQTSQEGQDGGKKPDDEDKPQDGEYKDKS
ncbi:MAG: Hsp70 family protein, partial [Patescibacteria group bacterium]